MIDIYSVIYSENHTTHANTSVRQKQSLFTLEYVIDSFTTVF